MTSPLYINVQMQVILQHARLVVWMDQQALVDGLSVTNDGNKSLPMRLQQVLRMVAAVIKQPECRW